MTTKRPNRRRFILDVIFAAAMVIIIVTGLARSILSLIFLPERPASDIAYDWIFIAVALAVVVMAVIGYRRLVDADEAARQVRFDAIRNSHEARPSAEVQEAIDRAWAEGVEHGRSTKPAPNAVDVTINHDGSLTAGEPYHDANPHISDELAAKLDDAARRGVI